ncbi:hypothetical protein HKD37_08G020661 [Glycine soja]
MVEHGRRPKFRHINMPLHLMAPPWWAYLHKLPMAVGKKSTTPWQGHSRYLTTLDTVCKY